MSADSVKDRIVALVLAWNEEASLPALLEELARDCPDWTVVVVSDGSTDETARRARESGVVVIELPFNSGVAAAEQTGLLWARNAGAQVVVRLDGDGQHPPLEARKVVDGLLASGADVAVGSRFLHDGDIARPGSGAAGSGGSRSSSGSWEAFTSPTRRPDCGRSGQGRWRSSATSIPTSTPSRSRTSFWVGPGSASWKCRSGCVRGTAGTRRSGAGPRSTIRSR